jgi:hypothetical protein
LQGAVEIASLMIALETCWQASGEDFFQRPMKILAVDMPAKRGSGLKM